MIDQKWDLRLEVETSGESIHLQITGSTNGKGRSRPVNECIAISMGQLMQSLLASGHLIRPSSFADSVEAFARDGESFFHCD